ncbi:hypothetical protein BDR26DRAFT_506949 [Obelidium mucronatum]|nr:hypothetical protein BDR26DRAFT_506949 [Obelidium mucronatum]
MIKISFELHTAAVPTKCKISVFFSSSFFAKQPTTVASRSLRKPLKLKHQPIHASLCQPATWNTPRTKAPAPAPLQNPTNQMTRKKPSRELWNRPLPCIACKIARKKCSLGRSPGCERCQAARRILRVQLQCCCRYCPEATEAVSAESAKK